MCYGGGVLCVMTVYCRLEWCTVCYGRVLYVMVVYCVSWRGTVC